MLLVAVVVAVVGPRLLSPGIRGGASAAPLPLPPAVGSCLNGSANEVLVVPCAEPHVAEVVTAWRAGERKVDLPAVSVLAEPLNLNREVPRRDQECLPVVRAYVGVDQQTTVESWYVPSPSPMARYLVAPADQGIGDQRWSACVATTQHGDAVSGSMRALAHTFDHSWPAAFTRCVALGERSPGDSPTVTCDNPHRVEILATSTADTTTIRADRGSADETTGDEKTAGEKALASCGRLAATVMGTTDPTRGGRLAVTVQPASGTTYVFADVSGAAEIGTRVVSVGGCGVELVGSGRLVGTVIGLREAPLPLG